MTDFQFQLLIGTILGSMLLIILAVVIAARVLYLETKNSQRKTFIELVEVHGDLQKWILKYGGKVDLKTDEQWEKALAAVRKVVTTNEKESE